MPVVLVVRVQGRCLICGVLRQKHRWIIYIHLLAPDAPLGMLELLSPGASEDKASCHIACALSVLRLLLHTTRLINLTSQVADLPSDFTFECITDLRGHAAG